MSYKWVVLLAAVSAVSGQSTDVSQCLRNPGDLPLNTYIENCISPPCLLPQLQDVVLHIYFQAPRTMRSMTTLVTAYISMGFLEVPINYNLQEDSVTCNFLVNTYCPVLATEVVHYTLRMHIESIFPVGTAVTLEFRVVDESNQAVLCIRVPIRVEPPLEGSRIANTTLEHISKSLN